MYIKKTEIRVSILQKNSCFYIQKDCYAYPFSKTKQKLSFVFFANLSNIVRSAQEFLEFYKQPFEKNKIIS